MKPKNTCRWCFLLLIFAGICAVLFAPALDTVRPHIQLDQVLSMKELADKGFRDETLRLLKRRSQADWPYWFLFGAGLITLGVIGLRATTKLPD